MDISKKENNSEKELHKSGINEMNSEIDKNIEICNNLIQQRNLKL